MDNRETRDDAEVAEVRGWLNAVPGKTVARLTIERRVLPADDSSAWPLTNDTKAQLNSLTHQLQRKINRLNRFNLTLQTFVETVIEQHEINPSPIEVWVIRANRVIVGYGLVTKDRHPVLSALVIDKRYRGYRLGQELLKTIRAGYAKESIKLFCIRQDTSSLQFYFNAGGIEDHDYESKYTTSIILPSIESLRRTYALPREYRCHRKD